MSRTGSNVNPGGDSVESGATRSAFDPPSLSLPTGGGAIRGIDEKYRVNSATGSGAMQLPIAASPGRGGFGPQLALSYDSSAGNGEYGLGWGLSLPAITRKTSRGLPRYRDAEESDVYVLSAADDLVPWLTEGGSRWQAEGRVADRDFQVHRYRPRIEGLFARIERWTELGSGDVHWRSITGNNVTTLYGATPESQISDPSDPTHVFKWLICESYDDKGNATAYGYRPEDSVGVEGDLAHERNRTEQSRSANRYLARIQYGNRTPRQPGEDLSVRTDWMFELRFDYGEGQTEEMPLDAEGRRFVRSLPQESPAANWPVRQDPFSSHRAGFEVRTYRLCRRVLMFHHFPDELGVVDTLVRSTEFSYDEGPIATYLTAVTHSAHVRQGDRYLTKSPPPVAFEYSRVPLQGGLRPADAELLRVREIDRSSLENLPVGLDGSEYHFVDLNGEGLSGILTEQGDTWFYKPNLGGGAFGDLSPVPQRPSLATLNSGSHQLLELAGNGQLDVVALSGPTPGFYERTTDEQWTPHRTFKSLPRERWDDPNLRFVDLTGDGRADVFITEDRIFRWYPSLGQAGFGAGEQNLQAVDEELGPRLVFADGTQSIHLADLSGDGLSDLLRIRNGELCYWPNLGYGRFGAKVSMDQAPWFDSADLFEQRRIRLADVDGSGLADIIYLGRDGVHIYFNRAGNSWGERTTLPQFPQLDDLASVQVVDLLGQGTACLVWSSPLPNHADRPLRYVDLMNGTKPHLLVRSTNNLGAETVLTYVPSTRFYLADKRAGRPWVTRLPFPVHVVERVETYDHIGRNRYVTRYAYHHGYFDGVEREFRGFGLVEQWDTESLATLSDSDAFPTGDNIDASSHIPPVLTKTWFHLGAYVGGERISRLFEDEYFREPGASDDHSRAQRLPDTALPTGLSSDERREAVRALKGSMLRQEVYALDGSERQAFPYSVNEQNTAVKTVQTRGANRHSVFFAHPREALSYHYERNPTDPRTQHVLTLAVDSYGNVLCSAAVGYGRRQPDPDLLPGDQAVQARTLLTLTESHFTNSLDEGDAYRTPLASEVRTYELTGLGRDGQPRIAWQLLADAAETGAEIAYHHTPSGTEVQKRLLEHVRTQYRPDDLGAAEGDVDSLLELGALEALALPGASFQLAFTDSLLTDIFETRVTGTMLQTDGHYVRLDGDERWWIPSGRLYFAATHSSPAVELAEARAHFFLPRRFRDPFGQASHVTYDRHDLSVVETVDALGNRVTAGERGPGDGSRDSASIDYRTLQPTLMTDPNGNRQALAFDALGLVAGTAVMGKPGESVGDSLESFRADLTQAEIDTFFAEPQGAAARELLGSASSRVIYDQGRYQRSGLPVFAATMVRETHASEPVPEGGLAIQVGIAYSDGTGRVVQSKGQAESGPVETGGPDVDQRWIGSGWTVFNNKGKPVRQYEPFFSATHSFEFARAEGVSPIAFYDPIGRVVSTLQPNHTYDKTVFDPWRQESWDNNDTVDVSNPSTDADVGDYFRRLEPTEYLPTWRDLRADGSLGEAEGRAAAKTAAHANTPAVSYFDSLGRPFLVVADNGSDGRYETRTELDIQGNPLRIIDPRNNTVMDYRVVLDSRDSNGGTLRTVPAYDIAGRQLFQRSMDAGDRWGVANVADQPLYAWDLNDRITLAGERVVENRIYRTTYDELRRPLEQQLQINAGDWQVIDRLTYGETLPDPEGRNLRGQFHEHYDPSGRVTNVRFDFKGALLEARRQMVSAYRAPVIDWTDGSATGVLDDETFTQLTEYDALGRMTRLYHWHRDGDRVAVYEPQYGLRGFLEAEDLIVGARRVGVSYDAGTRTRAVYGIAYDAKGQRQRVRHGNGTVSRYNYDPRTFRLRQLRTTRPGYDPAFPSRVTQFKNDRVVQNLFYTHDPTGNISEIYDDAYEPTFFENQQVDSRSEYRYDAIYRLIEATGRENRDFTGPPPSRGREAGSVAFPITDQTLRGYTQHYRYDEAGNFREMRHVAAAGSWTRRYETAEGSNRIDRTWVGSDDSDATNYHHDRHGSMLNLANVAPSRYLRWDYRDMIAACHLEGGGFAYYNYDNGKQRSRKRIERNGSEVVERLYLGGMELARRWRNDVLVEEIETHHLFVDDERVLMVDDVLSTDNPHLVAGTLFRYQYGNHLGSVGLEMDDTARIVSYDEYHPYGTSAFCARNGEVRAAAKRYRYTGMERDEETGLSYHTARYYVIWLGRWASADPTGVIAGLNIFLYAAASPTRFRDQSGLQEQPGAQQNEIDTSVPVADRIAARRNAIDSTLPIAAQIAESAQRLSNSDYRNALAELDLGEAHVADPTESIEGGSLAPGSIVGPGQSHDHLVLRVIRISLEHAPRRLRSRREGQSARDEEFTARDAGRWEILVEALRLLANVREISQTSSQNLVLRDADHYLAGRIAEWRKVVYPDWNNLLRSANNRHALDTPPNALESILGNVAAIAYDLFNWFDDPDHELNQSARRPRSPRGGVSWAVMGARDFRRLDVEHGVIRTGPPEAPMHPPSADLSLLTTVPQPVPRPPSSVGRR